MTSQWRHRNKTHSCYSELNYVQNLYFGFFIFRKLTELCRFVTYLWDDPRISLSGKKLFNLPPEFLTCFLNSLLQLSSAAQQDPWRRCAVGRLELLAQLHSKYTISCHSHGSLLNDLLASHSTGQITLSVTRWVHWVTEWACLHSQLPVSNCGTYHRRRLLHTF